MPVATVLRSSRSPDGSSGTTACVHAASTLAPRSLSGDSCRMYDNGCLFFAYTSRSLFYLNVLRFFFLENTRISEYQTFPEPS